MSKAKDEIEAKIGIKIQSTDVIIPPNHLSPLTQHSKVTRGKYEYPSLLFVPFRRVIITHSRVVNIHLYIATSAFIKTLLLIAFKRPTHWQNQHLTIIRAMSHEELLKDGRKKIVIVGGGAAGMVSTFHILKHFVLPNNTLCSPAPPPSHSIPKNTRSPSSSVCP